MANPRIRDGQFEGLHFGQLKRLVVEYETEIQELDIVQPTFEAWLAAKLFDLRVAVGSLAMR